MKPQSSTVTNRKGAKIFFFISNSPDISPSTRTDDLVPEYRTGNSLQTLSGTPQ